MTQKTHNDCNILLYNNRPQVPFSQNSYYGQVDVFFRKAQENKFDAQTRKEYAELIAEQAAIIQKLPMVITSAEEKNLYFIRGQSSAWQTLIAVENSLNKQLKNHGVPLLDEAYKLVSLINLISAEQYEKECGNIFDELHKELKEYFSTKAGEYKHKIVKEILDLLEPAIHKVSEGKNTYSSIIMDMEKVIRQAILNNSRQSTENNDSPGRLAVLLVNAHKKLLSQIEKFDCTTDIKLSNVLTEYKEINPSLNMYHSFQ